MSTLTQDPNSALYQVRGYKPGWLKINDTVYTTSLILLPDQLIPNWHPQNLAELQSQDFATISDLKPAILLLGTGGQFEIVKPSIYSDLINQGIGVEIMDTSAACRTFNALASEGRNVVAALLIK